MSEKRCAQVFPAGYFCHETRGSAVHDYGTPEYDHPFVPPEEP